MKFKDLKSWESLRFRFFSSLSPLIFPFLSKKEPLSQFYKELSLQIKYGRSLFDSLSALTSLRNSIWYQNMIYGLIDSIEKGRSFSQSMELFPWLFDRISIAIIKIGEKTNTLVNNLNLLSTFKRINFWLTHLFVYLFMLLLVGAFILTFFLSALYSRIDEIRSQLNSQSPGFILFIFGILKIVLTMLFILLVLLIIYFLIFRPHFQHIEEDIIYFLRRKIPIVGKLDRLYMVAMFFSSLGLLLKNGIILTEAVELSIDSTGYSPLIKRKREIIESIQKGNELGKSLNDLKIFRRILSDCNIHFLLTGEDLPEKLIMIGEEKREEFEALKQIFARSLEPILVIFIGFVILTILVSFYLEMFSISFSLPFE